MVRDCGIQNWLVATLPQTKPAYDAVKEAPVLIVACAELVKAGYKMVKVASDKREQYMFDAALAAQNLVLDAHALGLGTVYIGLFDAKKAASILDAPSGFSVVAMPPLAISDNSHPQRQERSFRR